MDLPQVGDLYGDHDTLSRYRVRVIEVNKQLCDIGRKGVRLENLSTGRKHWTSMQRLYLGYRLVRGAR